MFLLIEKNLHSAFHRSQVTNISSIKDFSNFWIIRRSYSITCLCLIPLNLYPTLAGSLRSLVRMTGALMHDLRQILLQLSFTGSFFHFL